MIRTGFANGQELWPFPDSLEYATAAINLDRGAGPVLHFGGYTYPTRYTIGFPLILAAINPLLGGKPQCLFLVTVSMALIALALLYLFTRRLFGRASAFLAGLLLASSPEFVGYSTYVMSDVPALAVALGAAMAFLCAIESESLAAYTLCGLLTGLGVIIRPTNGAIVAGFVAAIWWVGPHKFKFGSLLAFSAACAVFPALQGIENLRYFGSFVSNGYTFWVPEMYGSMANAFRPKLLFAPINVTYSHGNLVSYGLAILGADGWFGDMNLGTGNVAIKDARFSIYPFAAAVFVIIGLARAVKSGNRRTRRSLLVGAGFFAGLLAVYASYFYTDVRFLLPASFIFFAAAGYGLVVANATLKGGWGPAAIAVIALDALLAISIGVQTIARASAGPRASRIVSDVVEMRPRIANAIVISDISLQWLELYAGGQDTEFIALTTLHEPDPYTEYHIHWLYDWKSDGANVQVPPILCPAGELDLNEARKLADAARSGRPLYLLVSVPRDNKWALALNREFIQIDSHFSHQTVVDTPAVGLYRLLPR